VEAVAPATTSVFERVRRDSIATLRELSARLPDDRWAECVQAVDAADGILCFGLGPAGTVAEHLAIALTRLGMTAVATANSGIRLADRLATLASGWALVVFAPLRMFREIGVALDRARDVGATSVVITEALAREVRNRADIVLTTPPSGEGAASETLAPLVLAQALTMEIAALRSEQAAQHALLLERLRSGITGTATAR
jgi:DNA-binding MurR/RpiR family transcriptional regulator